MTAGVSLNSIVPVSSFSISSNIHSLTSKVNGVFGLYLTVAAGFFLYHATRCYQFIMNPSLQLHDTLKIVKCKILLKDIQDQLKSNARADVTSLVKECEALHHSMTKKNPTVSKGLFEYYSKKDPEQAYKVAQGFSSEQELFDACQSIHQANPDFDSEKLFSLLKKAYDVRIAQMPYLIEMKPLYEVKHLLKYVELAHSLEKNDFKDSILQQAITFATKCEGGLAQVDAWREIAKVCGELKIDESVWKTDQFSRFLNQAEEASNNVHLQSTDFFEAHLTLVKADLLSGKNNLTALDVAYNLYCVYGITRSCDLFPSLYTECGCADKAQKILNEIFTTLRSRNNTPNVDDANTCLRLVDAFKKHKMQDLANEASVYAMNIIKLLPDNTDKEIDSKFDLLQQVSCYPGVEALSVLALLERFYNKCSDKTTKRKFLFSILAFCNEHHFKSTSTALFESYLEDLTNSKHRADDKVAELALFANSLRTPEQRTRMLEAAEGFMSQVPAHHYVGMTTLIAEGYLDVNTAKSRELLDNYTKGQAKEHLLKAVIPAIALPIFHAYPMAGLFCFAAYTIRNMYVA